MARLLKSLWKLILWVHYKIPRDERFPVGDGTYLYASVPYALIVGVSALILGGIIGFIAKTVVRTLF